MQTIIISNGKLILPDQIIEGKNLYIMDGKIMAITNEMLDLPNLMVIDAKGLYVSPGFIDIHVHGGGGHDFMDNDPEGYIEIAKTHARYGTTSMNPTTMSGNKKDLLTTISVYDAVKDRTYDGAEFIGLHIEGPYFSMNQRGAQDPRYIRDPNVSEYTEIVATGKNIVRWSAAPELPGAISFGHFMKDHNIMPAIAHTDATYDDIVLALEAGFNHATHFYSCMSGVFRKNAFRYAGVVESAYLIDEITVEIIADGAHLPPPLLKLIYKIKGPDKIALITDAMRAAGTTVKDSILGSRENGIQVIIEDGVAKLPDRTAFAGSISTMDNLVRNMIALAGVPLTDAVKMATLTPARIMKAENSKGSLQAGKDADIILFDENIRIQATFVKGRMVYSASENAFTLPLQ